MSRKAVILLPYRLTAPSASPLPLSGLCVSPIHTPSVLSFFPLFFLQMFYSPDKNNPFASAAPDASSAASPLRPCPVFVCVTSCMRACKRVPLRKKEPPAWSWVIRHAALVTGNGVADGQAECIIDECRALTAAECPPATLANSPAPLTTTVEYLSISSWNDKRSHAQFP